MPQIKQNTIEDVNLRRAKLADNISLIETPISFKDLDEKIIGMLTSQGFLVKENGSGGLDLRVNETYFSFDRLGSGILDGFNLGERVYRLASKILLKYHEIGENGSRVKSLVEALYNVEPKNAIKYMGQVSEAISESEKRGQTKVMLSFFDQLVPKVIETFKPFYGKVDVLKNDMKIYRKHKALLDEAYYKALENVFLFTNSLIQSSGDILETLKRYSSKPIELIKDRDTPEISPNYLYTIAKSDDLETAQKKLEEKQKAIIVGLDYSSNAKEKKRKITLIFADRYMSIDRKAVTFTANNMDINTKNFLEYLGQQCLSTKVAPYTDYHGNTSMALRSINKHL